MHETPPTILIVEDHEPTSEFLRDNLQTDGYRPIAAENAGVALRLMETQFPDLALLDLGLPDRDGLELIRQVRDGDTLARAVDPDLPMVVLTGRGGELDRLRAFERGCDDYVVKPFAYGELRARLEAVLRRCQSRRRSGRVRIGSLVIDPAARQVEVRGVPVILTKKEFALLRALAAEPTRVFTRQELLRGVWGFQSYCQTRTLDSHASRLRHKLSSPSERFVLNVWGVGYRLLDAAIA